jgi:hypothetical protein
MPLSTLSQQRGGSGERRRHAQQPVAVAVGLDHGHHPGARRGSPGPRQVVAQRVEGEHGLRNLARHRVEPGVSRTRCRTRRR